MDTTENILLVGSSIYRNYSQRLLNIFTLNTYTTKLQHIQLLYSNLGLVFVFYTSNTNIWHIFAMHATYFKSWSPQELCTIAWSITKDFKMVVIVSLLLFSVLRGRQYYRCIGARINNTGNICYLHMKTPS